MALLNTPLDRRTRAPLINIFPLTLSLHRITLPFVVYCLPLQAKAQSHCWLVVGTLWHDKPKNDRRRRDKSSEFFADHLLKLTTPPAHHFLISQYLIHLILPSICLLSDHLLKLTTRALSESFPCFIDLWAYKFNHLCSMLIFPYNCRADILICFTNTYIVCTKS